MTMAWVVAAIAVVAMPVGFAVIGWIIARYGERIATLCRNWWPRPRIEAADGISAETAEAELREREYRRS